MEDILVVKTACISICVCVSIYLQSTESGKLGCQLLHGVDIYVYLYLSS